ncbi:unnamed protein product [Protopolystoma xenopodis]|uniref:Neurotransmitter-gated ion-channel transmembrane domain-containing protein n=1 Tax=Protopolystoma xenopodis TaxID=117903 RepID=A0A448XF98_9PLAT|nr:unnamed protein product [Protopolystoma xenopodis]
MTGKTGVPTGRCRQIGNKFGSMPTAQLNSLHSTVSMRKPRTKDRIRVFREATELSSTPLSAGGPTNASAKEAVINPRASHHSANRFPDAEGCHCRPTVHNSCRSIATTTHHKSAERAFRRKNTNRNDVGSPQQQCRLSDVLSHKKNCLAGHLLPPQLPQPLPLPLIESTPMLARPGPASDSEIDAYSRFVFPASFLLFNCIYWLYYLVLADDYPDIEKI